MFDFEWTGRVSGDDTDRKRGIAAALTYCADMELDPAAIWADCCNDDQSAWDKWGSIEGVAMHALAIGWDTMPENVSLIWR